MIISDRRIMQPTFAEALRAAAGGGNYLFQLREKDLTYSDLHQLTLEMKQVLNDAQCIVNGNVAVAADCGAAIHLSERDCGLLATLRRKMQPGTLIGASIHSIDAARRASEAGADYLVFGSVFPTASHPESTPAGTDELRNVCQAVEIPVFAIGGITTQNARDCLDAGAHGVAVIRAVWSTPDPARAVRELIEVLHSSA